MPHEEKTEKKKKELTGFQKAQEKIGKIGKATRAMSKSMKKAEKYNADRVLTGAARTVKRRKAIKMGKFGSKSPFR